MDKEKDINQQQGGLTAFVLEDDPLSCEMVLDLFEQHFPEFSNFTCAANLEEARSRFRPEQFDLLILDVELPDGTSLEFLEELGTIQPPIIFTTSHTDYAIQAIKFSAIDYLVKPLQKDEFITAVQKAIAESEKPEQSLQMKLLLDGLAGDKSRLQKIAVPTTNGLEFFKIEDIIRCEASGNYTYVFLQDSSKITVSRSLKEFEEMLPSDIFFRVHKSHLINLNFLKRFVRARSGIIVMDDDSKIQLASRKKEAFFDKLKKV